MQEDAAHKHHIDDAVAWFPVSISSDDLKVLAVLNLKSHGVMFIPITEINMSANP